MKVKGGAGKKMEIKHNWKLLIVIIVLAVILASLLVCISYKNEVPDSNGKCLSYKDCIKVQTGCCPCNMGGEEKCVFEEEVKNYEGSVGNCPEKTICPAFYNCEIEECRCVEGECIG